MGHPKGHPGGHPGGDIKQVYHGIKDSADGADQAKRFMMANQLRLVFWETTGGCNLECVHCRRLDISRKLMESDLSTAESKRLIDQIAETGKPILVLSGGEPLIRPDIFELAAYARDAGLTTALATNGTMITRQIAEKIRDAGIQRVSVSLDGATPETHDAFRKLPGSFNRAVEGIKLVQSVGVETQINSTIAKHNVHEVQKLYDNAIALGVEALHIFMLVPVGCRVQLAESAMLDAFTYEKTLNWFYEVSREGKIQTKATCAPHYFRIMRQRAAAEGIEVSPKTHGMAAMTKGCLAGQSICFVSHKGQVFPCGYLPLEVGNVREKSFKEIWETAEPFKKLRDQDNLEGKCGACEFKSVCEGCRARAFFYTQGNYLAEEPFCVYEPPAYQAQKAAQEMGG
ncbi:MAG: radical SAM protein [Nitrospinae bacterium]|nr:radical SAM protein [Nitrospinota bacterium]